MRETENYVDIGRPRTLPPNIKIPSELYRTCPFLVEISYFEHSVDFDISTRGMIQWEADRDLSKCLIKCSKADPFYSHKLIRNILSNSTYTRKTDRQTEASDIASLVTRLELQRQTTAITLSSHKHGCLKQKTQAMSTIYTSCPSDSNIRTAPHINFHYRSFISIVCAVFRKINLSFISVQQNIQSFW